MSRPTLSFVAVAALLGLPFTATAIVIDDFSVGQLLTIPTRPPNPQGDASFVLPGMRGTRAIELVRTEGFGSASIDVALTAMSTLSLATGPGVVANATVTYSNFGEADFSGDSALLFSARSDLGADINVSFMSLSGASSMDFVIDATGTGVSDAFVSHAENLSSFVGDVDWTKVHTVVFSIEGPHAFDLQLQSVSTAPVPEPTAALLFCTGVILIRRKLGQSPVDEATHR